MNHRRFSGLAAVPLALAVLLAAPTTASAALVRVTTLDGSQGWRESPDSAATSSVAITGAVVDATRRNGSLELDNSSGGSRAQAVLPVGGTLETIMKQRLGYDVFVGSGSATVHGANLQLEVLSPHFTTLSFQPQLNGGVTHNGWETFASDSKTSKWWSSRAVGSIVPNTPVTLTEVLAAMGGSATVISARLNVSAAIVAHVDNVYYAGNSYDFVASAHPVNVSWTTKCAAGGGGTVTFTMRNNTGAHQEVRITSSGLTPKDQLVEIAGGKTVTARAKIGTADTSVTTRRVGGGTRTREIQGCPTSPPPTPDPNSDHGDISPDNGGAVGGGYIAMSQATAASVSASGVSGTEALYVSGIVGVVAVGGASARGARRRRTAGRS